MSESILTTMTTAFSGEEAAFEWKLLYRFFGLLVQTGAPVSLETLAQALACARAQVVQVLEEQYPEAEYDASGNLIGVGLTLRPTAHQLVKGSSSTPGARLMR
jgi:alkylmercury lyase